MSDESPRSVTPYQRIQKSIEYTGRKTSEEANKPEAPWGVYRSDYVEYCQYFGINPIEIKDFVEKRKLQNTSVYGLDLLSSTTALQSLDINGIAVGLGDPRNEDEKKLDEDKRSIVTTNLLTEKKKSWKLIEEMMSKMKIESFDLILQRGVGGLESIGGPLRRMYHLQKMWKHLSKGGIILTEVKDTDLEYLQDSGWIKLWQNTPGIRVRPLNLKCAGLLISKEKDAPDSLPIPNGMTSIKELTKDKLSKE